MNKKMVWLSLSLFLFQSNLYPTPTGQDSGSDLSFSQLVFGSLCIGMGYAVYKIYKREQVKKQVPCRGDGLPVVKVPVDDPFFQEQFSGEKAKYFELLRRNPLFSKALDRSNQENPILVKNELMKPEAIRPASISTSFLEQINQPCDEEERSFKKGLSQDFYSPFMTKIELACALCREIDMYSEPYQLVFISQELKKLMGRKKRWLNNVDRYNMAPIHYAAVSGNVGLVSMLFDEFHCKFDNEIPIYAAMSDNPCLIEFLRGYTGKEFEPVELYSMLRAAAKAGKKSIIDFLVESYQNTPLFDAEKVILQDAVCGGQCDLIDHLVEKYKFNVLQKNADGMTYWHVAAHKNLPHVIDHLVEKHKVDLNARDVQGDGVLLAAVKWKKFEIVQHLIALFKKQRNNDDEAWSCPICLDEHVDNDIQPLVGCCCGLIGKECLLQTLNARGDCPLCRTHKDNFKIPYVRSPNQNYGGFRVDGQIIC